MLLLVPDIEACARWTQRLEKIERVVRLDSGASDDERAQGWRDLGDGAVRLAVGTRSALLAPLPAGAIVVMLDEHETPHNPPGAPAHSRPRGGAGARPSAAPDGPLHIRHSERGDVASR